MESMDPSQRSMSQGSMNASLPEPFDMHEMKSFMDKQSRVIILLYVITVLCLSKKPREWHVLYDLVIT